MNRSRDTDYNNTMLKTSHSSNDGDTDLLDSNKSRMGLTCKNAVCSNNTTTLATAPRHLNEYHTYTDEKLRKATLEINAIEQDVIAMIEKYLGAINVDLNTISHDELCKFIAIVNRNQQQQYALEESMYNLLTRLKIAEEALFGYKPLPSLPRLTRIRILQVQSYFGTKVEQLDRILQAIADDSDLNTVPSTEPDSDVASASIKCLDKPEDAQYVRNPKKTFQPSTSTHITTDPSLTIVYSTSTNLNPSFPVKHAAPFNEKQMDGETLSVLTDAENSYGVLKSLNEGDQHLQHKDGNSIDVQHSKDSSNNTWPSSQHGFVQAFSSMLSSALGDVPSIFGHDSLKDVDFSRLVANLESFDILQLAKLLRHHGVFSLGELLTLNRKQLKDIVAALLTSTSKVSNDSTSPSESYDAAISKAVSPIDRGLLRVDPTAVVGTGKFGSVYLCHLGSCAFAMKMVKVNPGPNTFQATMFIIEEAKFLMQLRHPNVVQYVDIFGHQQPESSVAIQSNCVCIVMEYCDRGSLSDIIFDANISLSDVVDIIRQLASALEYIHSCGVVHCDVKLENVLVKTIPGPRDLVKLGDFGLARTSSGCPLPYRAAESCMMGSTASYSSSNCYESASSLVTSTQHNTESGTLIGKSTFVSDRITQKMQVNFVDGRRYACEGVNSSSEDTQYCESSSLKTDRVSTKCVCDALPSQSNQTLSTSAASTSSSVGQENIQPLTTSNSHISSVTKLTPRPPSKAGPLSAIRGTLCYQAPETFQQQHEQAQPDVRDHYRYHHEQKHQSDVASESYAHHQYRWAVDVWCLGCLLWESSVQDCLPIGQQETYLGYTAFVLPTAQWDRLRSHFVEKLASALTQLPLYNNRHEEDRIASEHKKIQMTATISSTSDPSTANMKDKIIKSLCDGLRRMWAVNPSERPSAHDIAQSDFLDNELLFKAPPLLKKT